MIVDLLSRGGGHRIHCLVSDTAGYGSLSRRDRIARDRRQGTARHDVLDGPQVMAGNRCSVAGGW